MSLAEATLMPTFAVETFSEIVNDIRPLLPLHHKELAAYPDIPLDPDFGFYRRAWEGDHIRFYTGRLGGELIAYCIMTLVHRHPHYQQNSFAIADIVWVHPDHRNYGIGTALFDFVETDLKGCVIAVGDKISHPALGLLLKSRGYEALSVSYSKRL